MEKRIQTPEHYAVIFGDQQKRERALSYALDNRKFEIELYWKRAAYFWTLIAAAFAGYFILASADQTKPHLIFLVGCIGTVLSVGWYLANRGSKYWQENWERHVDALADEFAGPLFRMTISEDRYYWRHLSSGYPYSVSKINQLISLFVAILWIGITISAFPGVNWPSPLKQCILPIALAILTFAFVALLLYRKKTCKNNPPNNKPRDIDFDVYKVTNRKKQESVINQVKAFLKPLGLWP